MTDLQIMNVVESPLDRSTHAHTHTHTHTPCHLSDPVVYVVPHKPHSTEQEGNHHDREENPRGEEDGTIVESPSETDLSLSIQ